MSWASPASRARPASRFLSSGVRQHLLEGVAGASDPVLRPDLCGDLLRPTGLLCSPKRGSEALRGPAAGVAPRVENPGDAQPLDPQGVVGLIVGEGDH